MTKNDEKRYTEWRRGKREREKEGELERKRQRKRRGRIGVGENEYNLRGCEGRNGEWDVDWGVGDGLGWNEINRGKQWN